MTETTDEDQEPRQQPDKRNKSGGGCCRPPAAGRGRRKGEKNKSTVLREKLAEHVLKSTYDPKYSAAEILHRVMDGDTSFTPAQINAARDLLPHELPKLSAVMVRHAPPPPPAADALLKDAPLELLELLRDAFEELQRGRERAAVLQIEAAVTDDEK